MNHSTECIFCGAEFGALLDGFPCTRDEHAQHCGKYRRIIIDEADNISPVEWEKMVRAVAQQIK